MIISWRFSLALVFVPAVVASMKYSEPVGGRAINVPWSQVRAVSLPLLPYVRSADYVAASISGVGSNYLDVAGANWTPAAFSNPAVPYFVRILSGNAAGRVIPVSTSIPNTSSRLFLSADGIPLDQGAGPTSGDRIELLLADTLIGFFGTDTLQGGPDATNADNVQVWANTSWLIYYYNTTRSRWERSTDTAASNSRDNQLLRPDRGFMIVRRGTTNLQIFLTGRVPTLPPKHHIVRQSYTFFNSGIPVAMSLGHLSLQTRVSGWRGATSGSAALTSGDLVQVWGNTAWVYYYYDTSRNSWQRTTDTATSNSRDSILLQPGHAFMLGVNNPASTLEANYVQVPLPYP